MALNTGIARHRDSCRRRSRNATAVAINTEISNPSTTGYLRITPAGTNPAVATQEYQRGQSISNLAITELHNGNVQAKTSTGTARLLIDIAGYYTPDTGWSAPQLVDPSRGQLDTLSCPSTRFCVAGDGYGNAMTFDGATFCAAVDAVGAVSYFNGTGWTAPATIPGSYGERLQSITCRSASFCVAVVHPGEFVYSGTGWTGGDYGVLNQGVSVSCPSTTWCVAVDSGGSSATYDGSSWQRGTAYDPNGNGFNSISCASSTTCVAIDNFANYVSYDGTNWSDPQPVGAPVYALSCASASYCAAESDGSDIRTFDGNSWSDPVTIDPSQGGPLALSCPSGSFCALADSTGAFLSYHGAGWSKPSQLQTGFSFPHQWPVLHER